MTEQQPERVLHGVAVTGGVAIGPVWFRETTHGTRMAGSPEEERDAMQRAIKNASHDLETLSQNEDKLAADILEFQLALLDDEDFLDPVFARIDQGIGADIAWSEVLDHEIADYASADDDYMAARSSDLVDLRDRILTCLSGVSSAVDPMPEGAVLMAGDLAPSAFLALDPSRLGGIALFEGNRTSHVALLARARGVPMIVGLGQQPGQVDQETIAGLDADAGTLTMAPSGASLARLRDRVAAARDEATLDAEAARKPARTASRSIKLLINIDDPGVVDGLDPEICDGIGLTRTEFLFAGEHLPDEGEQYRFYAKLLRWADGRPVTIRTLDAGGDKPIPGVTIDGETNPFLGVRGLRLSLRRSDLFREQLRALARAAANGPLKIMLPMVTNAGEIAEARQHLGAVLDDLARRQVEHARPQLGIMVETPAAAIACGDWDAEFFSIGSNDLIQYVTASARDNADVATLADPRHPAVLELIKRVVQTGQINGVEVGLCGDMASTPDLVPVLLDLGLEYFSVAPAQVGKVKRAIAGCP
ncbi:MAG: phosphoenolpyruvate--protein phosphotransferase [Pseudomonadota bacterium]